jgi:hypothetical protein
MHIFEKYRDMHALWLSLYVQGVFGWAVAYPKAEKATTKS